MLRKSIYAQLTAVSVTEKSQAMVYMLRVGSVYAPLTAVSVTE